MRSARHREWRYGADHALRKDPTLEERFLELDKLITRAKSEIATAGVGGETEAFRLLEAYGDIVRELLVAGVAGNPIGAYPHVLKGLLRHKKVSQ